MTHYSMMYSPFQLDIDREAFKRVLNRRQYAVKRSSMIFDSD